MDIPAEISSRFSIDGTTVDPTVGTVDLTTLFSGQAYARKVRVFGDGILVFTMPGPLASAKPVRMSVRRGDIIGDVLFTAILQESTCGQVTVFR